MQINKININVPDSMLKEPRDKLIEVQMVEDACTVSLEQRVPISSFHKLINEKEADDNTEMLVRKLSSDEIELLSRMLEMLPLVSDNRFAAFQTREHIYQVVLETSDLKWMHDYVKAQAQLEKMYN